MNLRVPRRRGASTGTKVATRVRWDSARPEVWLDLDQAACAMLQTRLGTPSDVHLESAYYDTADLILHRAGIRLEVVRAGRHSVQRVTLPPALHRRDRLIHEAEAVGPLPDRGHLDRKSTRLNSSH